MSWTPSVAGDDIDATLLNKYENALGLGDPAQLAKYVVIKDGTNFYVRNGLDGTIDHSGTSAVAAIQAAIDACTANSMELVYVKEGLFDIGTTQIDATGVNFIGSGIATRIQYSGTSYAIKFDGSTNAQYYTKCGNFRIEPSDNDGKGILLYQRCHYFTLFDIFVDGPAHANSIGFTIDGFNNGCYWNNLVRLRTMDIGTGIKITTSGTQSANANNLISCILREPYSRGVDIDDGTGTIILGGRVEGSIDNTTGLYINDNELHMYGMSLEMTGTGADGIEVTANATTDIVLFPGQITTTGTQLIDGGSGVYIRHNNFVNSGKSTGTGAEQTIAHGLAITPSHVIFSNIEDGANPYQSSAADATNIYVTAVVNQDYMWKAYYES